METRYVFLGIGAVLAVALVSAGVYLIVAAQQASFDRDAAITAVAQHEATNAVLEQTNITLLTDKAKSGGLPGGSQRPVRGGLLGERAPAVPPGRGGGRLRPAPGRPVQHDAATRPACAGPGCPGDHARGSGVGPYRPGRPAQGPDRGVRRDRPAGRDDPRDRSAHRGAGGTAQAADRRGSQAAHQLVRVHGQHGAQHHLPGQGDARAPHGPGGDRGRCGHQRRPPLAAKGTATAAGSPIG